MAGMPMPAGSMVALITPMTESGAVDLPRLRELLQWHKAEGTAGIVVLGTTGEASGLSDEEKAEVMAATREEVGGELPIVVGTGTISTPATIAATKQAKLFGADAALIVTPYYVKPSQAGLLSHFTQIADSVDLPIILYNVPGRTGVDMSVETTVAYTASAAELVSLAVSGSHAQPQPKLSRDTARPLVRSLRPLTATIVRPLTTHSIAVLRLPAGSHATR